MSTLFSDPLGKISGWNSGTGGLLLGTAASGGPLAGLSGGGDAIPYTPLSSTSPGFSIKNNGDTIDLTQGAPTTAALTGINTATTTANSGIQGLLSQLGPGYDALTQSALATLESSRRSTVGNLEDNLARRRIAGSSFANDTLARANAEYAQQAATIQSTNKLASIDAANQLIEQQHNNSLQAFTATLDQLNLEGTTAAQVASGVSGIMATNAQLQAQLNAQAQAGTGSMLGSLANTAILATALA